MKRFAVVLLSALLGLSLLAGAAFAGEITIKGSTTVLPIAQACAEKFMAENPDVSITVSGGGSGNGIKALIDGTTDIAGASRPIKDREIKMAEEKGIEPMDHKVAIDAVIPVVHPSNPVDNLTLDQLMKIYTGKIKNWSEVGGEDKHIAVVTRDTSSGTFETWEKKVLEGKRVLPRSIVVASAGAMNQTVANNPLAIGYNGIGYIEDNEDIETLSINGIPANTETALSGEFPVVRFLHMYTDGEPAGDTKAFIDFIFSAEGQKQVKQAGFLPVK